MGFGRDRLLYISLSDGSYIGKVTNLAQNGGLPYGKILRVDVNKLDSPYYKIPPSNPYANNPDIRHDIWAIGIRNMWRWSFDRLTGDMWLADDGNSNRDEVNLQHRPKPKEALTSVGNVMKATRFTILPGACPQPTINSRL